MIERQSWLKVTSHVVLVIGVLLVDPEFVEATR